MTPNDGDKNTTPSRHKQLLDYCSSTDSWSRRHLQLTATVLNASLMPNPDVSVVGEMANSPSPSPSLRKVGNNVAEKDKSLTNTNTEAPPSFIRRMFSKGNIQLCRAICVVFCFGTLTFMSSLATLRSIRGNIDLQEPHNDAIIESPQSPLVKASDEPSVAEESVVESRVTISATISSIPPWMYFVLLSLQCGFQPVIVKAFTPKTVVRSTAVLAQEIVKLLASISYLHMNGMWASSTTNWTIRSAVLAAGLPAGIYVIQNYCNLMANQTLLPITFSVLNQTKTLSTAICCFVLLGQTQSKLQVVALCLLVIASLIVELIIPVKVPCPTKRRRKKSNQTIRMDNDKEEDVEKDDDLEEEIQKQATAVPTTRSNSKKAGNEHLQHQQETNTRRGWSSRSKFSSQDSLSVDSDMVEDTNKKKSLYSAEKNREFESEERLTRGVFPALLASALSGLGGTLAQKTLQRHARSTHLFNTELACFSIFFLLVSLALGSPDAQSLRQGGITQGWTWKTWIPIFSSSAGGILVGLVTKYQGAVLKGFTLIFGMLISGLLQHIMAFKNGTGGVTREQVIGGFIGGLSLWMHSSFPPPQIPPS